MTSGELLRVGLPFAEDLARHSGRPAILDGDQEIDYADLAERCDQVAEQLGPARRLILLEAGRTLTGVVSYLAALRAGHPVLMVGERSDAHARRLIEHYDPDVVIGAATDWRVQQRRTGSRHDLHPDLALLLPTSGSTGASKLVRLSYANLRSNAAAIASYLHIRDDDRAMLALPLSYCYGLSVLHTHLLRGAATVLTSRSVTEPAFWMRFREVGATTFPAVPYTFELLDRVGFESMPLPSLRYITQAGGRLAPATVRRYARLGEQRGWKLYVMYGQTEATARMAYLPAELAQQCPEAIGLPIPGGSFGIEASDTAPPGCGELVYDGPNVMLGYARCSADLARGRTLTRLHTGDLARRRGDGLYEIVGRKSRLIKVFGRRLDLDEIERQLGEAGLPVLCTGDDDGLALAVPDGTDPHRATRLAAEHTGLPAGRIITARYGEAPRLANGKVDYTRIREDVLDVAARTPAEPVPGCDPDRELCSIYSRVLGRPAHARDSFVSLGGDSLSYVELATRLEGRLGHLPAAWPTTAIGALAALPRRKRRWLREIETNVALRAAGILLIVAAHLDLWPVRGGGHILLAVAGYGFARFQLTAARARGGVRPMLRSALRIAVPSMLFIAVLAILADGYGVANVLLVNHYLGPPHWDQRWNYWFIEALVEILLVLCVLFAVPALRRLEARRGFEVALAFVLIGLLLHSDVIGLGASTLEMSRPHGSFWIFALGWAAQRASGARQRVAVSVAVVLTVPSAFPDDQLRNTVIAAGLLALIWISTLHLPRWFAVAAAVVAAASLHIYLTHWIVYPWLQASGWGPLPAAAGAVTVGVLAAELIRRAARLLALAARAGAAGRSRPSRLGVDPRAQQAELVALGIGEHVPGHLALADVDLSRAEVK